MASKQIVIKVPAFDIDFKTFKLQLWPGPAGFNQIKIGDFQKCKIHLCVLKGFKDTACQSWCMVSSDQDSNLGCSGNTNFVGLNSSPGHRKLCRTLTHCIFEVFEDTKIYFAFLEISNLYLIGYSWSSPKLRLEYPKILP